MNLFNKKKTVCFVFIVLALSAAGTLILAFITRDGIGLSPDSASYIQAARSLLAGQGITEIPRWKESVPMLRYAPLFSILLAAIGGLGIDPMAGARLLNTSLFGVNISLVAFLIFHCTQSRWLSLGSAFMVLTSYVMLSIHSMAWSEPACIFFGFSGLFLLAKYLSVSEMRKWFLVSSSMMIGLAFLQKYNAASFVAAGVLGILFFDKKGLVARMGCAVCFALISCFPMGLWVLRNRAVGHSSTGLALNFHPFLSENFRETLAYFSIWLLPISVPALLRGFFLLSVMLVFTGVFITVLRFIGKEKLRQVRINGELCIKLLGLSTLFIFSHLGVYYFTTAFLGRAPIDDRALAPVFVAVIIAISLLTYLTGFVSEKAKAFTRGFSLFFILLGISYLFRAAHWVMTAKSESLGYASQEWQDSKLIEKIKTLTPSTPIYTNGHDVIYILTGRGSLAIPAKKNTFKTHIPDSDKHVNHSYLLGIKAMEEFLRKNNGILVYFNRIQRQYYPTEDELRKQLPLDPIETFPDGTIYGLEK